MGRRGREPDNPVVGYVIVGALVIGISAAGWLLRDRLTGSPGELLVGDCFMVPTLEVTGNVSHIPCREPHTAEALVVESLAGEPDEYPEETAFGRWMQEHCATDVVTAYRGPEAGGTVPMTVGVLYPTRESWTTGARTVICYLSPADGSATTGSVHATPRPSP